MTGSTWVWRLLCTAAVGLGLASPGRAEDKDKKEAGKGGEAGKVVVIQLDASKVPPEVLKKLMELSRTAGDDRKGEKGRKDEGEHEKKGEKARKGDGDREKKGEKGRNGDDDKKGDKGRKDGDRDKGEKARKGDGDRDKGEKGKPNVVQVDLNKLSPELARRLKEELSRQKGGR